MPKISVIIPVYNAKDYLHRCLDSVCNQTLKDIEIICVDDCSTDNSFEILQEYASKYSNLKAIHCDKNGGESVARNIGLDNVSGEYIAFVDNDDEVDLDFYEKLYNKAVEKCADVVKGEARYNNSDGSVKFPRLNNEIAEYGKLYFRYQWWSAIFKTSLIRENNIRLPENYILGGDMLFLNQAVIACKSLELIYNTYYNYNRRDDSGDSIICSKEKVESVLFIYNQMIDNLKSTTENNLGLLYYLFFKDLLFRILRSDSKNTALVCILGTIDIYNKIKDVKGFLYEFCQDEPMIYTLFTTKSKEEIFEFYYKNNTRLKLMFTKIRYINQIKGCAK